MAVKKQDSNNEPWGKNGAVACTQNVGGNCFRKRISALHGRFAETVIHIISVS